MVLTEQGSRFDDAIAPVDLLWEDLAHIEEPRALPTLNLITFVMDGTVRLLEVRITGECIREPACGKRGFKHSQPQAARRKACSHVR